MGSCYNKGIPLGFQQHNHNTSNAEQDPKLNRVVFGLLLLFFNKLLDFKIPTVDETLILCFVPLM